jgi:hypothetical protein
MTRSTLHYHLLPDHPPPPPPPMMFPGPLPPILPSAPSSSPQTPPPPSHVLHTRQYVCSQVGFPHSKLEVQNPVNPGMVVKGRLEKPHWWQCQKPVMGYLGILMCMHVLLFILWGFDSIKKSDLYALNAPILP